MKCNLPESLLENLYIEFILSPVLNGIFYIKHVSGQRNIRDEALRKETARLFNLVKLQLIER